MDEYDLKVSRILRTSEHREDVLNLEIGEFLDGNKDCLFKFDKFQQIGKPYEYVFQMPTPQKPKRLLERIISVLRG